MLISPEHWIVGVTLSLNPCVSKYRETRYPDLGPVQIFPHFKLRSTQSRDFNRWECGKKNLRHSLKMFWVSLDHAPLERSKITGRKTCTDTYPGETKDPLGMDELGRFVN